MLAFLCGVTYLHLRYKIINMNWEIGQDIVAIVNNSAGRFKEGDVFTIKALRVSYCKCNKTLIDIGFRSNATVLECAFCKYCTQKETPTCWYSETCFAPLDSLADISELTEHLETTKPFEL